MTFDAQSLFGVAVVSANIRANKLNLQINEGLCNCFGNAFLYEDSSQAVYQQINGPGSQFNTEGFGPGTTYALAELNITNFIKGNYPESESQDAILALAVNSVLFAWSLFPNVTPLNVLNTLNVLLYNVALQVNNNPVIFEDDFGNITNSIFTVNILQNFLSENNYEAVLSQVLTSSKNTKVNLVNYNWYNVSGVFTQPNLRIMQDVENQYYYISGNLIYNGGPPVLDECIENTLIVNTITGFSTGTYILNQPCIDNGQYIGPITGVSFYRVFNDGPASIGDFNSTVKTQYIEWDQQILNPSDYESNEEPLFSFETGISGVYIPLINGDGNIVVEPNGLYNIENVEYGHVQDDFACVGLYQRMHIGDNRPRAFSIRDIHGNCTTGYNILPTTGFKFVTLKLNDTWAPNFSYIKTNPVSATGDFLERALNLNQKSYLSTDSNSGYFYTDLGIIDDVDTTYLGPPQFTGGNVLPSLAFFQEFYSPTFSNVTRLAFYPSIGTSTEGGGSGVNSNRTFQVSNDMLFSGETTSSNPLTFNQIIQSSALSDEISQQFFGMGNGFNNEYDIIEVPCQNAGYFYTGYYLIGSGGNIENIISLSNNSGIILGSNNQYINYINGYTDGTNTYSVSQQFAQDSSGNLTNYYYLDNRNLDDVTIPQNDWDYFCPLPDAFETNTGFSRVIKQQNVENYFPRYQNGPYSTETITFLYPNATVASNVYNSQGNGFPQKVQFTLSIKEETVREIYGYFFITTDGLVQNVTNIPIIRASSSGTQEKEVYMAQIFVPNSPSYQQEYDITNLGDAHFEYTTAIGLVDNLYSPLVNGVLPSGRNQNGYGDIGGQNDGRFTLGKQSINSSYIYNVNGVRITGAASAQQGTFYTGTGFQQGGVPIYWQIPKSDGLWHFFNEKIVTGYMNYVKPIFDLSLGEKYITNEMKDAFYNLFHEFGGANANCNEFDDSCSTFVSSYFRDIHGNSGVIQSGFDPFSLQYIGGESGGLLPNLEGGYNSDGVIGDLWNNFSYDYYGMITDERVSPQCAPPWRWPVYDNNIVLINSNSQTTNILTRGLSYSPFNLPNTPFISFQQIIPSYGYQLGNTSGTLSLNISGDYALINLNTYMPQVNTNDGLYDATGLIIGPFDRDMEMGVLAGNQLTANGDIYSQGHQIANYTTSATNSCDINAQNFQRSPMTTGIFPGIEGRDSRFTIIDVVPSGQTATINISGLSGIIGWTGAAILSLRPRKLIGQSNYDANLYVGEQDWINPMYFVNNGQEQLFSFQNGGNFENLVGKSFTFYNSINTGKLYPMPGSDITGFGSFDKFGNFTYGANGTVENYWKQWAFKNKTGVYISGVREGSRVCFTLTQVQSLFDQIPYQNQSLITPSGSCTISGQMGYYAEADNCIFTEGAFLVDITDPVEGDFNPYKPYFLSDVLNRLISGVSGSQVTGSGYLILPTGQINRPIISFPSVMEQRQYISGISGGQSYISLNNYDPDNYNKFLWPAISDLFMLNPSETIESIPIQDSMTYTNSNCIFSAAQGQLLPGGNKNANIDIKFGVQNVFQMYDTVATDAVLNQQAITENIGPVNILSTGIMTGNIFPDGTSLSMILAGLS
jgi:hypothetical protein